MTWLGYTEPTLAEELEACRRTARDCQLVLAKLTGAQMAPHEIAEARLAKQRVMGNTVLRGGRSTLTVGWRDEVCHGDRAGPG